MQLVYNKQIWEGIFTYEDGYDEADQYIDVNFKMELIFTDSSFTGFSTDSESKGLFDKPADVKGFVDDEKISFILNYPCSYYKDDNGRLVLDRESKHPEIHYLGFWDGDKNNVYGTWEMKIYEEKHGDDYIEDLATGAFEMRRVN
jgi:hypothetical protein